MKQSTREKLDTYSTLYDTIKTVVLVIILILLVPKVCQEMKEVRDESRLETIQEMMDEGKYNEVLEYMVDKKIYGPEFEYVWERLEFYTCYQRYLMYARIAETNSGNESYIESLNQYAEKLLDLYENVEYEENAEFVQKYYEKATKEAEKIPLERRELQEWSRYVNRWDKNGFLLSYYDTPEEIDLNELFYNGCGVNQRELSDKEREQYLELSEMDEIYTDCVRLTTRDIASVLRNGMGLEREDMKNSLDWIYLEDSECYVTQHGDTNAVRFTCTSGYRQGKNIILNCASGPIDCRVTLKNAEGDTWYFVSNEEIENTEDIKSVWLIEDQCFEVDLNMFGEVTFESYSPEASVGVFYPPSVSFELKKDGEFIYQFPEFYSEDSLDVIGTFESIKAIAFKDVNADGYDDVIAIVSYEEGDSVRIYAGEFDSFYYMEELSADINAKGKNLIMKDVLDHIGLSKQETITSDVLDETETDTMAEAAEKNVDDEIATMIGKEAAAQIRIMADNFEQWKVVNYPGAANYTVYDLDGDGRLELLTNVILGSGLFSENHFYQVNEGHTGLTELAQKPDDVGIIEFEIAGSGYDKYGKAYIDENGRIMYAAADYGKAGIDFVGCSEGYYYLENGIIYNEEIRSYTTDYTEDENGVYSYYGAGPGEAISVEEWERLYQNFAEGKQEIKAGIIWKSLYEEEAEGMTAEDWFELLADSYKNMMQVR